MLYEENQNNLDNSVIMAPIGLKNSGLGQTDLRQPDWGKQAMNKKIDDTSILMTSTISRRSDRNESGLGRSSSIPVYYNSEKSGMIRPNPLNNQTVYSNSNEEDRPVKLRGSDEMLSESSRKVSENLARKSGDYDKSILMAGISFNNNKTGRHSHQPS